MYIISKLIVFVLFTRKFNYKSRRIKFVLCERKEDQRAGNSKILNFAYAKRLNTSCNLLFAPFIAHSTFAVFLEPFLVPVIPTFSYFQMQIHRVFH